MNDDAERKANREVDQLQIERDQCRKRMIEIEGLLTKKARGGAMVTMDSILLDIVQVADMLAYETKTRVGAPPTVWATSKLHYAVAAINDYFLCYGRPDLPKPEPKRWWEPPK